MNRLLGVTLVLAIGSILVTDCAHQPAPPRGPLTALAEAPPLAPSPGPSVSSAADTSAGQRIGDPNQRELTQTRLVAAGCEANHRAVRDRVEQQVVKMREDVEAAWNDWRKRPECDESDGVGGLGLSGIGEGGGGYGSAIGNMMGGFGAGHGRLGGSHSRTNNQVEGVDEADIVKTDGRYLYLAVNGALRIVDAKKPRVLSVTKLTGDVRKMLILGDRAVVFTASGVPERPACTYGYDCTFAGDGTRTNIVVMDIGDRARPRAVRRIELSGSLMAARSIGSTVHTVVADNDDGDPDYETFLSDLPYCRKNEGSVHARFERLKRDNERRIRARVPTFPTWSDNGSWHELCDTMQTPLGDGRAFTTLLSFDMHDDRERVVTSTVQSRPGAVFASESSLYLSIRHERLEFDQPWYGFYGSYDELSDVHKFRIGRRPAQTRYAGSGVVPGHVLNQFAMDERAGYLRVATTRGRVPNPDVESLVSVLAENGDGNLARVGAIEHIAPSEDIRAVRFDGDRGYVVTFKKTDPLFVLDLTRPTEPRILGELKIPGFSTYLHRIDPTHLLSIGFDADDQGSFAYFGGIMLQLFDVTRPTAPELLYKERIGTRGSSSEAATDHLAFNYLDDEKLLAVPLTVCEGGGNGRFGMRKSFSGLVLYNVSAEEGFHRLGAVDHAERGKQETDCHTWWSHATSTVKRSVFVDDLVFSIASDRLKVQRMSELGKDVAEIALLP